MELGEKIIRHFYQVTSRMNSQKKRYMTLVMGQRGYMLLQVEGQTVAAAHRKHGASTSRTGSNSEN